jgi:integrase/recombinase XerD
MAIDAELASTGLAAGTRRKVLTVLRSILCRFAVEVGLLEEAPKMPKLPKIGATIPRALTREQVDSVLAQSSAEHRLAFMLAAFAGLRAGEVRALRWGDVDLKANRLAVRESVCRGITGTPKSGHERIVPLIPELHDALHSLRPANARALVAKSCRGQAFGENTLRDAFKRAARRAGLGPQWRFHDFRHFFVTELFRRGASARAIQKLAGHADLSTTERYAHVVQADLDAAIARLSGSGNSRGTRREAA